MTNRQHQRPVRRPVIFAAIALVGAAVLLVALRSAFERPAEDSGSDTSLAAEPERVTPLPEPEPVVEAIVEPSIPPEPQLVTIGVRTASPAPEATIKVILMPARVENPDPAAAAIVDSVRQATVRSLYAMDNVELVDVSSVELQAIVPPNGRSLRETNLAYFALSRRFEAELVAEISEQSTPGSASWMINLHVRQPEGSSGTGNGIRKNGDPQPENDPESLGQRFAQRIVQAGSRRPPPTAVQDAREAFLDTTRPEVERLRSLTELRRLGLDSETLAAAVDLAIRSTSAEMRLGVWSLLRSSTFDKALVEPLNYALLSDPDPAVRRDVALALAAYLGDGGTLVTLEHASRNDSSFDVRIAARLSTLDYDGQRAFRREILLDRSLTPAERLAPSALGGPMSEMMMASRFDANFGRPAADEALAYAEIVAATDDPELKIRALQALQPVVLFGPAPGGSQSMDPEVTRVVIASAASQNERVRRQALNALRPHVANPEVRAVLETVLEEEPALAAEFRLAEALEAADQ